jgi:hypothetical protein
MQTTSKENKNIMNTSQISKELSFSKVYVKDRLREVLHKVNAKTATPQMQNNNNKQNKLEMHTELITKIEKKHQEELKSIETKVSFKSILNEEVDEISKLKAYYINLKNDNMKRYNHMVEEEKIFNAKSILEQNDKTKQIEELIKETSVLREKSLSLESELQTKNVKYNNLGHPSNEASESTRSRKELFICWNGIRG